MVKIQKGNLFDNYTIPGLIVHGANAQGVMGSGFAAQFKKKFPDAYHDYINQKTYPMGSVVVTNYADKLIVCSAITQEFYGRDNSKQYVSYEAVEKSMKFIATLATDTPIFMPFIGGGLANGDRAKLMNIFETVFINSNTTIFTLD